MEDQVQTLAPLRIFSLDIECAAPKDKFPKPKTDPIITIACIVKVHGEEEFLARHVFTLQSCAPIPGTRVCSFDYERDMLLAWRDFLIDTDPDCLTGHCMIAFDLRYIIKRAEHLKLNGFAQFGRLKHQLSTVKGLKYIINIEGRMQLDIFKFVKAEYKELESYKLNDVAALFLGERKEEVHWSEITDL